MSKSRKALRLQDPAIRARAEKFLAGKSVSGNVPSSGSGAILNGPLQALPQEQSGTGVNGGGWGVGNANGKAATGRQPAVNPWLIPKQSGLSVFSQTYPSNYFVEWTVSSQRMAADRVLKQGFTPDWATLTAWCYQSSPFVQSLFRTVESIVNAIDWYYVDKNGKVLEDWTEELCRKEWQFELRREICRAFFWGFTGLNFDPINEMLYKYPMQDIDPLNRFLRQNTYAFWDGVFFEEHDNLLFIQPSTSEEDFLGWMQAITRLFVQMNMMDTSWVAAARKLAFPVFTLGYPETASQRGPNNEEINPYKDEAEIIAKDLGPGSVVVFPYVRRADGEIQKNIEFQFEDPGTGQRAHSIFVDFDESKKNEIREMVLGGTLTADVGNSGSRALGEVQERKLRKMLQPVTRYVKSYLNKAFKRRISKYYENFPEGSFTPDEAEQFTIEEIVAWNEVLASSGQRFTSNFFIKNGLDQEFFEESPTPPPPAEAQPLSKKDDGRTQNLGSKKKVYSDLILSNMHQTGRMNQTFPKI